MNQVFNKQIVVDLVSQYIKNFPIEKQKVQKLCNLLEDNSQTGQIHLRTNMLGHLTATAVIIYQDQVLMIHHNVYKKWLVPGGHFELSDQVLCKTALREAVEELGIETNMIELHPWHLENQLTPRDIDIHPIAANSKKNEGEHFHIDFRYLFTANKKLEFNLDPNEVNKIKWIDLSDVDELSSIYEIKDKVLELAKRIKN
jgi:8-oxo-dGTP pyrophosphatase MutT (NUDIX family)